MPNKHNFTGDRSLISLKLVAFKLLGPIITRNIPGKPLSERVKLKSAAFLDEIQQAKVPYRSGK
jgi:hypothetical protein